MITWVGQRHENPVIYTDIQGVQGDPGAPSTLHAPGRGIRKPSLPMGDPVGRWEGCPRSLGQSLAWRPWLVSGKQWRGPEGRGSQAGAQLRGFRLPPFLPAQLLPRSGRMGDGAAGAQGENLAPSGVLEKVIPKDTQPWLCCPLEGSSDTRSGCQGTGGNPEAILRSDS